MFLLGIEKYRVHEVAKDFNLPTKTITEILTKYATAPKNHMQVLETEELNLELKRRLPETFREFAPYLGQCRFVGCSHTKEKGCAVLEAVRRGDIQKKRHESYLRLYEELKPLKDWQEKKK